MVLNPERFAKSACYRPYWVQRNASPVRPYWTEVVEARHSDSEVSERAALFSPSGTPEPAPSVGAGSVTNLLALFGAHRHLRFGRACAARWGRRAEAAAGAVECCARVGTFVQLPSVIVLEGSTDRDRNFVRTLGPRRSASLRPRLNSARSGRPNCRPGY